MYIEPHVFRACGRYVLYWRIERLWLIPDALVKHTYELTLQLKSEAAGGGGGGGGGGGETENGSSS